MAIQDRYPSAQQRNDRTLQVLPGTPPVPSVFLLAGEINDDLSGQFEKFAAEACFNHLKGSLFSDRIPNDLVVFVCSDGGSKAAAARIIKRMGILRKLGIPVWTCTQYAASAAVDIQANGDKGRRIALPTAKLGLHASRIPASPSLMDAYKDFQAFLKEYPDTPPSEYPLYAFGLNETDFKAALASGHLHVTDTVRDNNARVLASLTGQDEESLRIALSDVRMAWAVGEEIVECGFADMMIKNAPTRILDALRGALSPGLAKQEAEASAER